MKTNKVFWGAILATLTLLLAGCGAQAASTRDPLIESLATGLADQGRELQALESAMALEPTAASTTEVPGPTEEITPKPTTPASSECTGNYQVGNSTVEEVVNDRSYPSIIAPDPNRQVVFPDVPCGSVPALAEYALPWEDSDYFEDAHGDVDVSEWHYRYMTNGHTVIDELNIDCEGSETRVCAVLIINESGPTVMYRDAIVDNGFTIAGFVWDMGSVDKVSLAAQRLLDHIVFRTTVPNPNPGANCSRVKACDEVEWYVVVLIDGNIEGFWTGLYQR